MTAIDKFQTAKTPTENIGQVVDELITSYKSQRYSFERRWYDNQFFDDGYHFRFLQRTTNKIVDLSDRASMYNPVRAIPKASRQVRGIANLLMSNDPTPTVYPEKVNAHAFDQDPQGLEEARKQSKWIAKLVGHWIEEEFKNQEINEKLAHMLILSMVKGVSYMQIWPDAVDEAIRTQVYDAHDIYLDGSLTDIQDCPILIKGIPKLIVEIKANELFDPTQREKISPDNKLASSEIKEAYQRSRYGSATTTEATQTVILKEAFIKEYLNKNNKERIRSQQNGGEILKEKDEGDVVIRHSFVAGNIWLFDEYLDIDKYPFVDFRMEPGPIYQVPMIERFIPTNKSLDTLVSRIERYAHTMVVGSWSIKNGEPDKPSNQAGGQIFKYNTTPPQQNPIASVPPFMFNFIQVLNSFIEEQGVSTTTLGKIPAGVKAARAIESLKESEYANLVIAQRRFKQTVRRIAMSFMNIADDYFVQPQSVMYLEKGEPQWFDIMGKSVMEKRQQLGVPPPPDTIPISKEYHVDIEVEAGMGYTKQGKQQNALELANFMVTMAQQGFVNQQAVAVFMEKLLETYQFGSTSEFMEALEENKGAMTDQDIEKIKVGMMEVMKDLKGSEILPDTKMRIEEGKIATAEVIKDTGMLNKEEPQEEKPPSRSISYKDLSPEGKSQLAAQAGIQESPENIARQEQEAQEIAMKQAQNRGDNAS